MTICGVECVSVYKCLADETRLRILNLLRGGPLCVCHVQEALQLPQSKVSKQLGYMKKHGLLISRRYNNWTIYDILRVDGSLLDVNLRAMEATFGGGEFRDDLDRIGKLDTSVACVPQSECCADGEGC